MSADTLARAVALDARQLVINQQKETYVASYGDSRMFASRDVIGSRKSKDIAWWLEVLSNQTFRSDYQDNFGVTGETTAQILARIGPVLASRCRYVLMHADTNDYEQGTEQDTAGNLARIWSQLRAAGKTPIYLMPEPRGLQAAVTSLALAGGDNTLSATSLRRQRNAIAQIRQIAPRYGVVLVDANAYLVDPASTAFGPRANKYYDGLHATPEVAFRKAQAILAALQLRGLYLAEPKRHLDNARSYNASDAPYANVLTNPLFAGTGGTYVASGETAGASSDVATGWTLNNSNMAGVTVTAAKVTDSFGFPMQSLTLSGTPTAVSPSIHIRQTLSAADFSPGDVIESLVYIEVDAGMAGVQNLLFQNRTNIAGVDADMYVGDTITGQGTFHNLAWSGLVRMGPNPITGTFSSGSVRLYLNLLKDVPVSATIRLGSWVTQKVRS